MPYKCPKCKKPLSNELDIHKVGMDPTFGYFIQSALLAVVGSGRSPYWCCTNPECRCCYSETNKFWFKINMYNQPVPKGFIAGTLGIYPPKKRKNKKR